MWQVIVMLSAVLLVFELRKFWNCCHNNREVVCHYSELVGLCWNWQYISYHFHIILSRKCEMRDYVHFTHVMPFAKFIHSICACSET